MGRLTLHQAAERKESARQSAQVCSFHAHMRSVQALPPPCTLTRCSLPCLTLEQPPLPQSQFLPRSLPRSSPRARHRLDEHGVAVAVNEEPCHTHHHLSSFNCCSESEPIHLSTCRTYYVLNTVRHITACSFTRVPLSLRPIKSAKLVRVWRRSGGGAGGYCPPATT